MVAFFTHANMPKARTQSDRSAPHDPLAAALARGERARNELLDRCGGTLTSREMANYLSVSLSTLYRWRAQKKLFWLKLGGNFVYPRFQLTDNGLMIGISEIASALDIDDPWMSVNFMLTGDYRLNNEFPLTALKRGEFRAVLAAAKAFGSQGAA